MTTLRQIELSCPICGNSFQSQAVVTTNAFGGKRTDFHERAAVRCRLEPFLGRELPFLSCRDLAVFKAFFNRTKDWADLEEMHAAGTLDVDRVLGVLVRYLGAGDERVGRLRALAL